LILGEQGLKYFLKGLYLGNLSIITLFSALAVAEVLNFSTFFKNHWIDARDSGTQG
jgi:hypothetical protein